MSPLIAIPSKYTTTGNGASEGGFQANDIEVKVLFKTFGTPACEVLLPFSLYIDKNDLIVITRYRQLSLHPLDWP